MNEKDEEKKENINHIIDLEGSLLVGGGIALIFVYYFGVFKTLIPAIILIVLGIGMWIYCGYMLLKKQSKGE